VDFVLVSAPIIGILALLFAFYKARYVESVDPGSERMKEIASYIEQGAMAFLRREYNQ